jgi:hypothetical protein
MRFTRVVAILLALSAAAAVTACGAKSGDHGHGATHTTPEPPPPTPDFTPITLLRTPAGLVLHTEAEVPDATAPAAETTPAPSSAPGVTP